jgi:6-pyruvoyltetrahydropterin/6-carboxytetrahydropterin synthase
VERWYSCAREYEYAPTKTIAPAQGPTPVNSRIHAVVSLGKTKRRQHGPPKENHQQGRAGTHSESECRVYAAVPRKKKGSTMNIISKEFHFSASHILHGLEPGHPCGRMHGHNYVLRIVLAGEPDQRGFVVDYRELEPVKQYVDGCLDHRHLNDAFACQPSVENMSRSIYERFKPCFPQLIAVEMSETPKTLCRYQP